VVPELRQLKAQDEEKKKKILRENWIYAYPTGVALSARMMPCRSHGES